MIATVVRAVVVPRALSRGPVGWSFGGTMRPADDARRPTG
jgi:hypothetical protein